MKLIFLDIDGVLNSQLYYTSKPRIQRGRHDIDPEAVIRLNSLIFQTGAKVVISSTWRLNRTVEKLQQILEDCGFKGEVIDKTLDLRIGEHGDCVLRGNEVYQWLKAHPVECGCEYWDYKDYVILDDDSDFLYWQRNNLFLCDPYVGLTPNIVYRAARQLGIINETKTEETPQPGRSAIFPSHGQEGSTSQAGVPQEGLLGQLHQ